MFRIKKLDIFIVRQFGLLFVATFFICQFVLMMQFLWRYVDELIGKGLTMDVLAQFFWYMGLMLMPQAFPLAILLSSLIAFGNMGESSELTAIKAAGISLMQAFRSLIVIVVAIACCSYYFQDVIGPEANKSFGQLLLSMKQKSPELEIPEGIFYDGIPGTNLYVQKKDLETGMLYGIMIYRMNNSWEDQAIILADSGRLQSTAEKKHLLLTLYSGEWFENLRQQDMARAAEVPYRRETFWHKQIVLDFDGGFNLAEVGGIAADARSKSMAKLLHDLDSIHEYNDSVGHSYYDYAREFTYHRQPIAKTDSLKARKLIARHAADPDSAYGRMDNRDKQTVMQLMAGEVRMAMNDIDIKRQYSYDLNRNERMHQLEAINKITLSLSCIIFFFIGAPLGAIIRKGGLGVPVIISVIVFIIFYIFDNTGTKMARDDNWTVLFGKLLGTAILAPIAVFFTYKANNDSVVFNIDLYRDMLYKMLGIRRSRHVYRKEVIIQDPEYSADAEKMKTINAEISAYAHEHHLLKAPNPIKVFFRPGDDHAIEEINEQQEAVIEDLQNTKDKIILHELNSYPFIATHAHTRPFSKKWMNIVAGLLLPLGIFFYLRMWRFRLRLYRDLHVIRRTNENIVRRIAERQAH